MKKLIEMASAHARLSRLEETCYISQSLKQVPFIHHHTFTVNKESDEVHPKICLI